MTTVDALKALYVKKGGALTDTYSGIAGGAKVGNYMTIPDMIQAITQVEAVSLPAVDADDNGKVLAVSGGAWSAVTQTPELPAVDADDNGKVLTVSDGAWSAVTPTPELPAVDADDNGKVLKVADGAWGIGTDLTE